MDNILSGKKIFAQYFREKIDDTQRNNDGAILIALAQETLQKNRMLHYEILKSLKNSEEISAIHPIISSCMEYNDMSKSLLQMQESKPFNKQSKIVLQGGVIVNSPIEHFKIVYESWNSYMEFNTVKAGISLLGAIWAMLFGDITELLMTTYLLIALYFVVNTFFAGMTFSNIWVNIKSFLMVLFWLIVANLVTSLIQIKALPDEALHSAVLVWIIYAETKGIAENCEQHGYPVPEPIKKVLNMETKKEKL